MENLNLAGFQNPQGLEYIVIDISVTEPGGYEAESLKMGLNVFLFWWISFVLFHIIDHYFLFIV